LHLTVHVKKVLTFQNLSWGDGGVNFPFPLPFNPGSRPVFVGSCVFAFFDCKILHNIAQLLPFSSASHHLGNPASRPLLLTAYDYPTCKFNFKLLVIYTREQEELAEDLKQQMEELKLREEEVQYSIHTRQMHVASLNHDRLCYLFSG